MDEQSIRPCALITGASGGLGEAFVYILASEGYDLMIVARNDEELNRVAGIVSTKLQANITPLAYDLCQHDACDRLARDLRKRRFTPDIVINNAGFGLNGPATELDHRQQVDMINLNVRTLSDLTLRYLPGMIERGTGGIMNVASVAGFMPGPYMAVYYATKAYVVSFTDALSSELRGTGIKMTAFCPGPVDTGFQARAGMENSRLLKFAEPADALETAQAGWDGFKRRERVVVPGVMNKVFVYGTRMLPRRMVMPLVRFLQKPRAVEEA